MPDEKIEEPKRLDGPPCTTCGAIMVQTGKCFTCPECGANTGCS